MPVLARVVSNPFVHACMSSYGEVRGRRQHTASVFGHMSGMIVPVSRSTIG
jgi:hypothetical protein